jgi:hypothetical protein
MVRLLSFLSDYHRNNSGYEIKREVERSVAAPRRGKECLLPTRKNNLCRFQKTG